MLKVSFKKTFSSFLFSSTLTLTCFQGLEDAFLAIDSRMTTEEVIKELVQISGRPTEELPAEKVAEEDDCECSPDSNIYLYFLLV